MRARPYHGGAIAARPVLHPLLGVVAVVLALVMSVPVFPASALAGSGASRQVPGDVEVATVTLTSVRPGVATREDVLVLRGVLTNVSDADLVDPLPVLRWSGDPLQTVEEVDLVASNPLFRYGRVDYRFSESLPTLAPGERAPFMLEVPVDALLIGSGVFVFGVDVLASLPSGLRVFVASARTTVPVDIDADRRVAVALLWPVVGTPSLLPDGSLTDDALAEELATAGRLQRLLSVADDSDVTWVVDPDLLATVGQMADGYETLRPPGAGSGAADAARFQAEMNATLAQAGDVRQIPAADPDVGGALAGGVAGPNLTAAVAAGLATSPVSDAAGRAVPPLAVLTQRAVTNRMLGIYLRGGVATAVLDPSALKAVTTDGPARLARPGARDITAVVARFPSSEAPTAQSQPAHLRQWLLATTAVLASSPRADAGALVVAPPLRWNPRESGARALVQTWESTQWIQPVSLSEVAAGDGVLRLGDRQSPQPVNPAIADGLTTLAQDVERLQPLFADPVLVPDELPEVTARAVSYAWQQDPTGGIGYVQALGRQVSAAERQVGLVVSPAITLSSRSGRFPITLVNDSDVDVVVGVDFTSQNSTRLRVEDVEPLVLDAGEKRTVTATALATANGRLEVTATLVTTENAAVGSPVRTIVDVTNVGALGWTVIGLGGVLLVAALVRARLKARRQPTDVS